jgi:hypothetical protein
LLIGVLAVIILTLIVGAVTTMWTWHSLSGNLVSGGN